MSKITTKLLFQQSRFNKLLVELCIMQGFTRSQTKDFIRLSNKFDLWYKTRGSFNTVQRIKLIRTFVVSTVTRSDSHPDLSTISIDKDGFPKCIPFKLRYKLKKRSKKHLRMFLTVCQVTYIRCNWVEPSTETIEEPSSADNDLIEEITNWFKSKKRSLFPYNDKLKTYWDDFHLSTKAGPLGPSFETFTFEIEYLPDSLINDIKVLAGFGLYERIKIYKENLDYLKSISLSNYKIKDNRPKTLRRITYVKSPEGKSRVISIFDYWSQSSLKTLHNSIFDLLRTIKQDKTFNQKVDLTALEGKKFSFDLTAATDRFPVKLQRNLLEAFIGKERADSWHRIMCKYPSTVSWNNRFICYNSGQPMGAYSSWAVFTLSHHIVVQYSAYQALGLNKWFTKYQLLGDDIVIADSLVAAAYKEVIQGLGIEINRQKSIVSEDSLEFSKRIFIQDQEVTPFPLTSVIENIHSPVGLWGSLTLARERGFQLLNSERIPGALSSIRKAYGLNPKGYKKVGYLLEALSVFSKFDLRHPDIRWSLKALTKYLDNDFSCNHSLEIQLNNLAYVITWGYSLAKLKMLDSSYQEYRSWIDKLDIKAGLIKADPVGKVHQTIAPIQVELVPQIAVLTSNEVVLRKEAENLKSLVQDGLFFNLMKSRTAVAFDVRSLISNQPDPQKVALISSMMKVMIEEANFFSLNKKRHLNLLEPLNRKEV